MTVFDLHIQSVLRDGDPCIVIAGSCREYSLDRFNEAMKIASDAAT